MEFKNRSNTKYSGFLMASSQKYFQLLLRLIFHLNDPKYATQQQTFHDKDRAIFRY